MPSLQLEGSRPLSTDTNWSFGGSPADSSQPLPCPSCLRLLERDSGSSRPPTFPPRSLAHHILRQESFCLGPPGAGRGAILLRLEPRRRGLEADFHHGSAAASKRSPPPPPSVVEAPLASLPISHGTKEAPEVQPFLLPPPAPHSPDVTAKHCCWALDSSACKEPSGGLGWPLSGTPGVGRANMKKGAGAFRLFLPLTSPDTQRLVVGVHLVTDREGQ